MRHIRGFAGQAFFLALGVAVGACMVGFAAADDPFAAARVGLADPPLNATALTPDDSNDLAKTTRALWVGGDGNIKVTTAAGDTVIFYGAKAGTQISGRFRRVWSTSTTATYLVGQY